MADHDIKEIVFRYMHFLLLQNSMSLIFKKYGPVVTMVLVFLISDIIKNFNKSVFQSVYKIAT